MAEPAAANGDQYVTAQRDVPEELFAGAPVGLGFKMGAAAGNRSLKAPSATDLVAAGGNGDVTAADDAAAGAGNGTAAADGEGSAAAAAADGADFNPFTDAEHFNTAARATSDAGAAATDALVDAAVRSESSVLPASSAGSLGTDATWETFNSVAALPAPSATSATSGSELAGFGSVVQFQQPAAGAAPPRPVPYVTHPSPARQPSAEVPLAVALAVLPAEERLHAAAAPVIAPPADVSAPSSFAAFKEEPPAAPAPEAPAPGSTAAAREWPAGGPTTGGRGASQPPPPAEDIFGALLPAEFLARRQPSPPAASAAPAAAGEARDALALPGSDAAPPAVDGGEAGAAAAKIAASEVAAGAGTSPAAGAFPSDAPLPGPAGAPPHGGPVALDAAAATRDQLQPLQPGAAPKPQPFTSNPFQARLQGLGLGFRHRDPASSNMLGEEPDR